MIFPEIFITGVLPESWTKESLIADGLSGWACCMVGAKPPEQFGQGMALISEKIGTAIPEKLEEMADKLITKQ
jgi:hypothetical protein